MILMYHYSNHIISFHHVCFLVSYVFFISSIFHHLADGDICLWLNLLRHGPQVGRFPTTLLGHVAQGHRHVFHVALHLSEPWPATGTASWDPKQQKYGTEPQKIQKSGFMSTILKHQSLPCTTKNIAASEKWCFPAIPQEMSYQHLPRLNAFS